MGEKGTSPMDATFASGGIIKEGRGKESWRDQEVNMGEQKPAPIQGA